MDKKSSSRAIAYFVCIFLITLLLLFGCKPRQIVTERYIVKTDSSLIYTLKDEINQKTIEAISLKSDINRIREENTRLQSEITTHIINYDTNAQLKEDGKYPVAQEIISSTKQTLEKLLRDTQTELVEEQKLNNTLLIKISNLQYELESKTDIEGGRVVEPVKKRSTWWRWLIAGFLSGGIIVVLIRL